MAATLTFTKPNRPLTWLITGCSSGFGLSLARLVQSHGHTLIATSRQPSRTPELVSEVESRGGKWLPLDVDSGTAGAQLVESLERDGTQIDVLVNNAGYSIYTPVELATEDEVRTQMETIYFGPSRLIRAVVPRMRARRFGVVVNMSSGAALMANESMGAYAAGKAALDAAARVLAKEVAAFNIRVLTVQLGTFNTNMGNTTVLGKNPLPEDYKGSMAETMMQFMSSGKFVGNGDKDKGMKAVYEVVVGEGIGAGREAERLLPLGADLSARIRTIQEYYGHALDVFGEVCDGVALEKK